MFKSLLRNTALYAFSLYLLPYVVPGVTVNGGVMTMIIGGFALTLMFLLIKPVFNVLTFPLNMITLGLFSIVTNAVILYLLTVFVPNITVSAFTFPGASLVGFAIPKIAFNTLFAFATAAVVLSAISGTLRWLIK